MSKTIIHNCDRCGSVIEPKHEHKPFFYIKKETTLRVFCYFNYDDTEYELCSQCRDELEEWLEKGMRGEQK